jgi:hypothetical protein
MRYEVETGKGIRFLRFARTKGCTSTKPFHWPLISYSLIILILSCTCTAGLKWNTGELYYYYSTVELGYQHACCLITNQLIQVIEFRVIAFINQ